MKKVAFLYDFDLTLIPTNMQEYGLIQSYDMTPSEFWSECAKLEKEKKMDPILTYMYLMLVKTRKQGKNITKEYLRDFGKNVELFEGVEEWFDRIDEYARKYDISLKHYVISSGLTQVIKGTKIANKFDKIFASDYMYDAAGNAIWPAITVNYTHKTQFIFRVNKGSLDISDNKTVNEFIPHEEREVQISDMVYFGDGESDVPCMKVVKNKGGYAVAVHSPAIKSSKAKELVITNRANYMVKADYREGSKLDKMVKFIIREIAKNN